MDALALSRLQFAVTIMFHFIFVPLTLGLSMLVAWMETRYVRTGDASWLKATKFWGKLFLINFALGVVTGITMEFQFGMNWAEYSRYVGDVFGAPLAIEATMAFFLESVFLGVWIFGWNKLSKRVHALVIWLAAVATNLSALWIILANGWMQHPVGYHLANRRAEMTDFGALVTNPAGLLAFGHQIAAGFAVAGFFILGISSWHLLRSREPAFFARSFRLGAVVALVASILVAVIGDSQGVEVAKTQPSKFAAMESLWESGERVSMNLFQWPDADNDRNHFEAGRIPGLVSILAFHDPDARVTGLRDMAENERPPVWPTFLSFRLMVGIGMLMILVSALALWFSRGKTDPAKARWLLSLLVWALPLPYLAIQLGWVVAEIGRQPWIVYGVLKTSEAVSRNVSAGQVWFSLGGFILVYGVLGAVDIWLLFKYARKGPDDDLSKIVNVTGRS